MDQNKKPASIPSQEKLIEGVITQLIDFKSKVWIKNWIKSKFIDTISEEELNKIISLAFEKIKKMFEDENANLINTHASLYNKISNYYKKIGYTAGLNKALKAKEALLRVGKASNINITHENITTINTELIYDSNRLTAEEKQRMELYESIVAN